MKYFLIVLGLCFLIGCGKRVNEEPIRVYIEKELPKRGVLIWGRQIEWVDLKDNPDLIIKATNELPQPNWRGMFKWYGIFQKYMFRPAYIYIKENKEVVMAHEFGNFLGYPDHKTNIRSIMYPHLSTINKPLEWFIEFGGKNE